MTLVEIVIGSLIVVVIFVIGVIVGLYINQRPRGTGRHRQPTGPHLPSSSDQRIRFDERRHISQQGLDDFRRGFKENMETADPSRMDLLRDYVDEKTSPPPEGLEQSPWEKAVASWREADKPIDWGLTEEEKRKPLNPKLVEAMHDPLLDQKLQQDPEYLRKMGSDWEGLSGTLEPEPEQKVLRPEETSSSLLGLSGGAIKPTGGVKPVFGETEHLIYDPEEYEEPLICEPCKRPLVKGETFWTVALPEEGEGVFIPICDKCEAKSHG